MSLMAVICVVVFAAIVIVLYNIVTQKPCDSDNVDKEGKILDEILTRLREESEENDTYRGV